MATKNRSANAEPIGPLSLETGLETGRILPSDDRRRHPRFEVRAPARCLIAGETMDVVIVDASEGGVGLDRALPCEVDSEFQIEIADVGKFRARLAWKSHERCGLELLPRARELTPAAAIELAGWLKRVEDIRGR